MRNLIVAVAGAVAVAVLALGTTAMAQKGAVNTLTPEEKAAGWRLLFNGTSLEGWRGYKKPAPPDHWKVADGAITVTGRKGDLITTEQFKDFELSLEWKLGKPGGNSGLMFRVVEEGDEAHFTGPEVQIIDAPVPSDPVKALTANGSNYALHAPARDVARPLGQWNQLRVLVKGAHVEHWLNGEKLLEYELWSPDWEARMKASKFVKMPGYGRAKAGHIALQEHGDPVAFRNIKIRELNSPFPTPNSQ